MDSFADSSGSSQTQGAFFANQGAVPSPISSLGRGLQAIKQRDYETAIAQLEIVCQSATDEGTLVKAQMGLVVAYARRGDRRMAIALCKPLCTHSSEQVKVWAKQMMGNLEKASTAEVEPSKELQDRVPSPVQPADTITQLDPADETGFVPLADAETGFVPLEPPPQRPQRPAARPRSAEPTTQLQSDTVLHPEGAPTEAPTPTEPTSTFSATDFIDSVTVQPDAAAASLTSTPQSAKPPLDTTPYTPVWRNAGRAQRWAALPPGNSVELRIVQVITLGGFIVWAWAIAQLGVNAFYCLFAFLPLNYTYPPNLFWPILIMLAILLASSPWLLHWILKTVYGLQPLSTEVMTRRSPETMRSLKRVYTQKRQPLPSLNLLPTSVPLAMSYGLIAQQAHLVISQGLLDQLQDDEIAATVIGESSYLLDGTSAVLTGLTTVLHLPYLLYWRLATWGDRLPHPIIRTPLKLMASACYGIFWILQIPGYWLCRYRQRVSDRFTMSITGNPNGLTRALVKQAIGISRNIQQQQESIPILESCRLLTPLSDRMALTVGSLYACVPLPPVLQWDRANPYRFWFVVRQSHEPLGERLAHLEHQARQWRLEPEFNLFGAKAGRRSRSTLLLQIAPLIGLPIGIAFALGIWFIGLIAPFAGLYELSPLWGDRSILWGCSLVGLGFGLFMQINALFPTIRSYGLEDVPPIVDLLTDQSALPIDSHPVRLQGHLLGYRGLRNALEQDLAIKTTQGTYKLRFLSPLGSLGNLLPQAHYPHDHVRTPVVVQGWLRRGALPWIDVDTIAPQRGRLIRSGHPIWVTLMATVSVVVGLFIILRGA